MLRLPVTNACAKAALSWVTMKSEIEDELHMLAKCTVLADLRAGADLPHQTLSLLTLKGLQDTFSDRAQCPQSQALKLKLKDYKKIGAFIFACFEKRKLVLDSLGNN